MTRTPSTGSASALPYHVPVMADEVVRWMADCPDGPLVDGTLGGGGHTAALAAATPADRPLVGVDQDGAALREARARLADAGELPQRLKLLQGSFADLRALLDAAGVPTEHGVAGILLDLGVSSHQLDAAERGFGLKHSDAPLDMRMDRDSQRPTAADLLDTWSEDELAQVLREFGEVQGARGVARALKRARAEGRLSTTGDLARVVESVQKPRRMRPGLHPATTVFQALRIAVNDELTALDRALSEAPELLCEGGRLVVLSYHSLEDRRVKQAFREGERGPERPGHLPPPSEWTQRWRVLTSKPISASDEEIRVNPRARSARLRVAERAPLVARRRP
ncbi:MAG: 16S rRNA (cytosine(1402)-N(4))-methyltransferase RsmH [Deltaproteobacteria bacterium]|nr:16S rRNA (cytosine(1402)-N(4))-methyltransferase RsmH [Deltaproteobacteria bacterium]MCB9787865.1 16S rRNA (cytosine(1402)-N(4))-methyltransferase RsmH [Deltaproteobacteria bacterium]